MNTHQLICALNCDIDLKRMERGVLAADQLPKIPLSRFPSAYIVNTDPSHMQGKHWVAFYFDEKKEGEFFDSYGNSPHSYNRTFLNFLLQNSDQYQYNDRKLQNEYSNVCGQYCVYYLMYKSKGFSMNEIVNSLSFDHSDQYVYDFVKNVFFTCFSSQILCTDNQNCNSLAKIILWNLYSFVFIQFL